ncbi:MAG: copper resistance CopC family protein [Chloroflexota bacterium]|nr:copper resistance protein CopC [Chloroflexota bacterium]
MKIFQFRGEGQHLRLTSSKWLALVLALVVVTFQVGIAFAHAHLQSSTILPDATITAVPTTLTLTFGENTSITQSKLQVLDASGKQVDKGDLKVVGATTSVSLGTLTNGKYTVNFRSFTENDNGIVAGNFNFTLAIGGTAVAGTIDGVQESESIAPGVPNTGMGYRSTLSNTPTNNFNLWLGVGLLAALAATIGLVWLKRANRSRG